MMFGGVNVIVLERGDYLENISSYEYSEITQPGFIRLILSEVFPLTKVKVIKKNDD